jgi:hypothetical protein
MTEVGRQRRVLAVLAVKQPSQAAVAPGAELRRCQQGGGGFRCAYLDVAQQLVRPEQRPVIVTRDGRRCHPHDGGEQHLVLPQFGGAQPGQSGQ